MKKNIIIFFILVIVILSIFISILSYPITYKEQGGNIMEEENPREYQGPVRPTDDEENFRKTGETKPLENKE